MDLDLTVEEVDALTGPAVGRAKSATFRTADIAGVDVASKVAENLYAAVTTDPQRALFKVPDFMKEMVKRGAPGREGGRRASTRRTGAEILALDWKTLEYRPRQKPKLAVARRGRQRPRSRGPLRPGHGRPGRQAAQFLWRVLAGTSLYAAVDAARRSPTTSLPSIGPWSGVTAGALGPSGCWTRWA